MAEDYRKIERKQLHKSLRQFRPIAALPAPKQGWIKTIRLALGMNARQLARRMGITPPTLHAMERGELQGKITIKTLIRAATALNCELVYAIVPRTSLDEIIADQAGAMAARRILTVAHSMILEDQEVSAPAMIDQQLSEVQTILERMPRALWDEHDE